MKKYLAKLITLGLFSLGLLSCSSTPEIYKPIELNSVKELETGQKIIYYSSDENLAQYLKQRLEREIPKINSEYEVQNLPVTFYIIPTYRDWEKYYCFNGGTLGTAYSGYGSFEVFVLTTNQHRLAGERYKNNYIAHTGTYATYGYQEHAKRVSEKQQAQ